MKKINLDWETRIKNPIFWAEITVAVVAPILAYFGMNFSELTTWNALFQLFVEAIQNPVIVVSIIVSVHNTITNPLTNGLSD